MSGDPYLASEDSALLRGALKRFSGGRYLEIGAGNCGNLVDAVERFGLVVGTDLVRPLMTDWREGANFVLADCASCIRTGSFDLVAFNPPYVRGERTGDGAVDGGPLLEVPRRFLREALRVVKERGRVVFLLDDGADMQEFEKICAEGGFGLGRVGSRRMFFEELAVYEAAPSALLGEGRK